MRIAFVDCLDVAGGLSRFSYLLCKNIIEQNQELKIDYYVHKSNLKRTPELLTLNSRVSIITLQSTIGNSNLSYHLFKRIFNKVKKVLNLGSKINVTVNATILEIEQLVDTRYTLAYFPVAHMMKKPKISVPIVGTIHDFNWKYFFGSEIFTTQFVQEMDVNIIDWLNNSNTACSSYDVINEAKKLYPNLEKYPEAIHIAPVIFYNNVNEEKTVRILKDLEINYPYIIFPGNFFPHKNHLNLFAAFSLLRKRPGFETLKLILTGINTDKIAHGIATKTGVILLTSNSPLKDYDIRGLGYQTNEAIEVLIKNAELLVSPSIYEAICTPAMDAWHLGTPTAISAIPPFKEHEDILGIKSEFFDPMDINNIADTLENYLKNKKKMEENAIISKLNISNYTWEIVAKKYFNLFKEAIKNN